MANFLIISTVILGVTLVVLVILFSRERHFSKEEALAEPIVSLGSIKKYTPVDSDEGVPGALAKIEELTAQKARLEKALEREIASKELKTISEEEQKVIKEKEEQTQRQEAAIESLTQENYELKKATQNLEGLVKQYTEQEKALKEALEKMAGERQQESINRMQKMEQLIKDKDEAFEQLRAVQIEAEKKDQMIERLEKEKQAARTETQQATLSAQQLSQLEEKNEILMDQIKGKEAEISSLRQEVEAIQAAAALKPATVKPEGQSVPAAQSSEWEARYKKLKELNDFLMEKEKVLQYELTKSRVQAMGLEKLLEGKEK